MSGEKQGKSQWVLVDMEKQPVLPEVQKAREEWEGQEVWFLTPWKQWRRGKVQHIYNSEAVRVVVYQKGTFGLPFAFEMRGIPVLLKHAGK